jgi:hypothetical protein
MPFDFTPPPTTIAPPKTLQELSYLLRHQQIWPSDFEWYYGDCKTCAMGLVHRLHGLEQHEEIGLALSLKKMEKIYGIGEEDAGLIFSAWMLGNHHHDDITPEDVADAIDRYLETQAIAQSNQEWENEGGLIVRIAETPEEIPF